MIFAYKFLLFLILFIILYFSSFKLYKFIINKKNKRIVLSKIDADINKVPIFNMDSKLKSLSLLWTQEYLSKILGSKILSVTKMRKNILNFFKGTKEIKMRGDFFFELITKDSSNKLYYAQKELDENLKKDIFIPPYIHKENICNIVSWFGTGSQFTPLHFDHDDGYLCLVKGFKRVRLISPKDTNKIKAYKTLMYSEYLSVDNLKKDNVTIDVKEYNLREGDYLFIPSGWWHEVQSSNDLNIAYTIWINTYEGKYNYNKIMKKMQLLQLREIPEYIRPKSLENNEMKKLWDANIINGNIWEKNLWIQNPMYTDKYD